MFPPNPVSKQTLTFPSHSFKFLFSILLLSVGTYCGAVFDSAGKKKSPCCLRWWSRAAIELLWSSTYWGAFESDSLEWRTFCQGSHLQNTTSPSSARSVTHRWPSEDGLRQSRRKPTWNTEKFTRVGLNTPEDKFPMSSVSWQPDLPAENQVSIRLKVVDEERLIKRTFSTLLQFHIFILLELFWIIYSSKCFTLM